MAILEARILRTEDTDVLFGLAARSAGSTIQLIASNGNSILSSLFVKDADPGTTVEVKYFQTSSGTLEEDGERQDLVAHPVKGLADAGETNTILVTRLHNKPACEIIITGPGTITFGVYVSIRSETASDLDSALKLDDETADLIADKGIPMVCLNEDGPTDVWKMVRCSDAGILVDVVSGTIDISGVTNEVDEREFGTASVVFGASSNLISFTPGADLRVHRIMVGGDGAGEFTVKIGSDTWAILRNAWNDRQVQLAMNGKKILTSDTITIDVENITPAQAGTCTFEAFIYHGPI